MKAGWQTKNLADLCTYFGDGDWIESKDQSLNGIRLIQTGNVGEGIFKDRGDKARYISEETFAKLRCTEVFEGDCLISRLPDPVGRSAILPDTGERMITAVDCTIVRFNHQFCLPEFFNYYSQSTEYIKVISERCTGTTRNRISRSQLGNTPIPTPDIGEQRRIVSLLDEAFADIATAKANAEKNLQNARELFSTQLQIVFGESAKDWIKTTIGEHIRFIDYRGKTPIKTSQGLRLITAKNVKMGFIQKNPEEFVAPDSYDSWMTRGIPNKGDVLFTTEAPLANVAQLDIDEKVVFAQRIIIMQPNRQKLDPTFLKFLLLSPPIQQRIKDQGTGATVQGIKASLLKKIEISFPAALNVQTSIVEQLESLSEEVDRLESLYRQKLTALDDLKKSLLHQAFSGKL